MLSLFFLPLLAAPTLAIAAPAYFAVASASSTRPFGLLAEMLPSRLVVAAGAAIFAAVCAAVQFSALPSAAFMLLAPPAIGAAPWAAGELFAGPSRRQEQAYAAALVCAYAGATAAACACDHLLCRSLCAACAATAAYLAVRGATPAR